MTSRTSFLISPHILSNAPNKKTNIIERDWSTLNHEELIQDFFSVDWSYTSKLQNNKIDSSFQYFFESLNNMFDKLAPFKKINKHKLKFKTKPWITIALQKSISIKNKTVKNYIKRKDLP